MTSTNRYDAWHQRIAETENAVSEPSEPWHVTVARLLPDLNEARVLEIGCGRGDFALWIARTNSRAKVTAIDFSEAAIAVAKTRSIGTANFVHFDVQDAEALSFEDCIFDLVVSCECLEHVPNPEKMTKEIHRLLVPGGRFILTTENYCNGMVLAWIKSWFTGEPFNSGAGIQPHENFFVFWKVKRLLERSGLVVDHMESNHFQWLLLPRVSPPRLCTKDFKHTFLKQVFRPFGRHFTFSGIRPPMKRPATAPFS
jgi:ubiquinone/menaquinone biosynthesis C-methylase UbiE